MSMTPLDPALPCPCPDPCCRTHPLVLAGLMSGWMVAGVLAGILLGRLA